jgi:tetratricopeptide (TPR) repeat protein
VTDRTEFLQRSIADLEAEHAAGDLSDEDYVQLRSRFKEALQTEYGRDSAPAPGAVSRPHRRGRAVAIVLAIVLVASLAGGLVARWWGERVAGQASSGNIDEGANDKLARAQDLVQQGKLLDAIKLYDAVLKSDPKNPVALAQRGWLLRSAGLADDALTYVDRAIAADPTYPDAHFFKAMILWKDKGNPAGAVPEFQLFLANTPDTQAAAQVEPLLKQATADAATTTVPQQ